MRKLRIYLFMGDRLELSFSRPEDCIAWWQVQLPETAFLESTVGRGIQIVYNDFGMTDSAESLFGLLHHCPRSDYLIIDSWDPENWLENHDTF